MSNELVPIQPVEPIEIADEWAALSKPKRKQRAARASSEDDREELRSLLISHVILWGRAGTTTSDQTLKTYWRGAKRLLDWAYTNTLLPHNIGPDQARQFATSLHTLSPKSQSTYLSGAKAMVAALRWAGLGDGDPFHNISVRDNRTPDDKANPYSDDELSALIQAANERELTLILLGADAGLRLMEVTNLQWQDIDFNRGRILVSGKGNHIAKITATPRLLRALEAIRDKKESGPIFGVSRRRIQQIFDEVCRRAEVNCRGFHQLRHSCGTRLYRQSKDLALVARHLRHSSTKTSEIYVTLADEDYDAAVLALEENGIDKPTFKST